MTLERLMTFFTTAALGWLLVHAGLLDTSAWSAADGFFASAKDSLNVTVVEDAFHGVEGLLTSAHGALEGFLTGLLAQS